MSIVVIGSILCFILRNKVKTCLKRTTHDGNDEEGIDSIAQGTIHILRNQLNHLYGGKGQKIPIFGN